MKAGTTTLFRYLARHPSIFTPRIKEPQFFSRDQIYQRGLDWYKGLFVEAGDGKISGEASTCYTRWPVYPLAAERIRVVIPDAKLIYIVRHPVDRLYSHYVHRMRRTFLEGARSLPSFEQFVAHDDEAVCASRYAMQINHLQRFFDQSQLHIALFEDLTSSPDKVLNDIQSFIGLDVKPLVDAGTIRANAAETVIGETVPRRLSRQWARKWRQRPLLRTIADLLPNSWRTKTREVIENSVAQSPIGVRASSSLRKLISPLNDETRAKLCHDFKGEVEPLESMLGRDLQNWLK